MTVNDIDYRYRSCKKNRYYVQSMYVHYIGPDTATDPLYTILLLGYKISNFQGEQRDVIG